MKKIVYEIDSKGFIMEHYETELDVNGNIIDEKLSHCIPIERPHGLFKAKWVGGVWSEGETEEEKADREAQQLLESLKPSPSEIADAELEIKIATMLTELGVTQ